ncbi:unnamed protein product [Rotaria magnacalcarata]|uniref:CCHC-type domain-containing protein n=4 Tax=Rotaria magnacalcarata TaxID=392030 RepID=A0A816AZT4_9BILA|nr:unnamed protein product [Rotaria magnacalcarata]CAF1602237.1 unnamed protein product [Rotaria magnacalcarata]CAF2113575.1 unnamed protein product [Rotaria magnacalcarata]CAF2134350.1 unnamed protein product [Rotaria magnacalcarata]
MVTTRLQHHQLFAQEVQRLSLIDMEPSDTSPSSHSTVYRPLFTSNMEAQFMSTLAKEQVKTLTKFSGSESEDVTQWLKHIEEVFDRALIQSSNKYLAIQSYLTDAALKWFRFNKTNMLDWSSFKIAIVQAYQPSIHQALLKMEQRTQLHGESVMEYYYDKLNLCVQADANMSSSMIIHYLTKGLHDSLIAHVIRRHPATPNEFLNIAQDEEKILLTWKGLSSTSTNEPDRYQNEDIYMDHNVNVVKRPINIRNQSSNWQHNQSPPQPLMQVPIDSFPSSSRRSSFQHRPSSFASPQCYECQRFGHIARYCPNRKNF